MPIYRLSTSSYQDNRQITTDRYTKSRQSAVTEANFGLETRPQVEQRDEHCEADTASARSSGNARIVPTSEDINQSVQPQRYLSDRRLFDCDSFIVKEFEEQQRREEELRQQRFRPVISGAIDQSVDKDKPTNSSDAKPLVRVQPYEDPYDDFQYSFIRPHDETVLQREIRVIHQREGSMRRVHGYPALSKDMPVEVHLTQSISPRETSSVADKSAEFEDVAMKRLATNRLRLEILKETQRELDLRKQGKIFTISEERIGQPLLLSDLEQRLGNTIQTSTDHLKQIKVTFDAGLDHIHKSRPGDGRQKKTRTVGEILIEEEVKELKRREEELREQRKLLIPAGDNKQSQQSPSRRSTYGRM